MSNKHFRRLINAEQSLLLKNEIESLTISSNADKSNDDIAIQTKAVNKFALLDELDEDCLEFDVEENNTESSHLANADKKRRVKKNKKLKKKMQNSEMDNDIDALSATVSDCLKCDKEAIMKIDYRLLDPDVELRRLLGRTFGPVVGNNGRSASGRIIRRNRLVKVKPNWPKASNLGFYMILCEEKNNSKYFRFRHKSEYQELQQMFWNFQSHMDFENIMHTVLEVNPFHLDALLLMAENLRINDDIQASINILEMGIFACERAFHPQFRPLSSNCKLKYCWWENRAFYLFLHRYMMALVQGSCFATALEFAKIIYLKDDDDPLAISLLIDSLSLRAKNYKFLIDFYEAYHKEKNLDMLPNFLYSLSLANISLSSDPDDVYSMNAENFMILALSRFPFILGQILDKLQVQSDASVESNPLFNTLAFYREAEGLRLISNIYIHHSIELWRPPKILLWLERVTHKILPRLSSSNTDQDLYSTVNAWKKKRNKCFVGIPRNILRHAYLHSISYGNTTNVNNSNDVDPFPPQDSHADYFPELNESISRANEEDDRMVSNNTLVEFLRTLIPDEFQLQLQQFSEAIRGYIARYFHR